MECEYLDAISETIIGIILALSGAFINNFGVVLQKRQVNIKAPPDFSEKKIGDIGQFLKDPIWILGILMQTIIYLPFLLFAYSFIGITLLQPLSNAGVIFLVLGLILMLNERLKTKFEYFGIGILIFGVISIALGGVVGKITIDIFMASLQNFWFLFSIILSLSFISLLMIIKNKARFIFFGFFIGNMYSIVSISLQWLQLGLDEMTHTMGLLLLILGILGAVLGTVFGILGAQEAYKRGQAINIVPYAQITMNLFPIFAGLFVFQQTITNLIFFWIGVISIMAGASMLTRFEG